MSKKTHHFTIVSGVLFLISILLIILMFVFVGSVELPQTEDGTMAAAILFAIPMGAVMVGIILIAVSCFLSLVSDLFAVLAMLHATRLRRIAPAILLILNLVLIFPFALLIRLL